MGGGRGRAPVLVGASGDAVGIPVGTAQNRWRYIKLVISAGRLGKLLSSMYFELNRPDYIVLTIGYLLIGKCNWCEN